MPLSRRAFVAVAATVAIAAPATAVAAGGLPTWTQRMMGDAPPEMQRMMREPEMQRMTDTSAMERVMENVPPQAMERMMDTMGPRDVGQRDVHARPLMPRTS